MLSFSSCDLLILYSLNEGESGEKKGEGSLRVCVRVRVCACVKREREREREREGGMIGRTVSE